MAVNARPAAADARGAARAVAREEARLAALRGRREREHEALLRAAKRVFLRRGYAGARVDDVLREAGMSTRAFYRLHASKEELFLELFDRANAAAMRRLEEGVARHETTAARLDAYVEATLDLAYDPRLARQARLFATVPTPVAERHAAEVLECRRGLVSVLRGIIERGRRRDELAATGDAEIQAWALHGALGAVLERALARDDRPPQSLVASTLRRLVRDALASV